MLHTGRIAGLLGGLSLLALVACEEPGTQPRNLTGNDTGALPNVELAVSPASQKGYRWITLSDGERAYLDRDYFYLNPPTDFRDMLLLQTANDDKVAVDLVFVSFYVNKPATVYVAYDQRVAQPPIWLCDWENTGQTLNTNDTVLALYAKNFAAGQVLLGGNNAPNESMYTVLVDEQRAGIINDTGRCPNGESPLPQPGGLDAGVFLFAHADFAVTAMNQPVVIDVLGNDEVQGNVQLAIQTQAKGGEAAVESGKIRYQPAVDFAGADQFEYSLGSDNGAFTIGKVQVQIDCPSCPLTTDIVLRWTAAADVVSGYEVYFAKGGPAITDADATQLKNTVQFGQTGFSMAAPEIRYNAWNDFHVTSGEKVCLRVRAVNAVDVSGFSQGACAVVP